MPLNGGKYDYCLSLKCNLITYFKINGQRYPTVSNMFRDYYSIQGSSIPCECEFLGIPDILRPARMRIKLGNLRVHMELKSWLKPGNQKIFEGCVKLEEMLELEGRIKY